MSAFTVTYQMEDGSSYRMGMIAIDRATALELAFDDMPKGARFVNLEQVEARKG